MWYLKTALSIKTPRIFFSFLVMIYDRVGDDDKFSYENFDLGRHRFHAVSHLKFEAKIF